MSDSGEHQHCTNDPPLEPQLQSSGELVKLRNIDAYVSKPADLEDAQILLFFTNGVGYKSVNNQLQADQFAKEGYLVLMPDLFEGDPAPNAASAIAEKNETEEAAASDLLERVKLTAVGGIKMFMIDMWLARHSVEKTLPIVNAFLASAKEEFPDQAVNGVYAVGYCFGGKYVLKLAQAKEIKAGAVAHGILNIEDFRAVNCPVSLVCAEDDPYYPPEMRSDAEKLLEEAGVEYESKLYDGTMHGFAVFGSYKDPKIKAAQENAWHQMLGWIQKH